MRIAFAVVLLVLWPFHRHKPVYSAGPSAMVPEVMALPESQHECDRDDAGEFVFLGPDAVVGISAVSCDAAFEDWRHNPAVPALLKA